MTTNTIDVGLLLPTGEPIMTGAAAPLRVLQDLVSRAETAGFDSLWAGESLVRERFEPLATLLAAATCTDRMALGTAVMVPAFRQPVATAQAIATLDRICQGRLVLGVGAGYPSPAMAASLSLAGVDYRRRYTLLDDIVDLWATMWAGGTRFHGAVLNLDGLPPVTPARAGGPPVWIAADTHRLRGRAGRYQGWLPYPPDVRDYRTGRAAVFAERASDTGPPPTAGLFATVCVGDDPALRRADLTEFCRSTYNLDVETVRAAQLLIAGTGTEVTEQLASFIRAGARHLVIRMAQLDPRDQIERLAPVVAALHRMPLDNQLTAEQERTPTVPLDHSRP